MEYQRAIRQGSYALAGCVVLVVALLLGLLEAVPFVGATGGTPADGGAVPSTVVLVGLPAALAVAVLARATTRRPTDVVLGSLAVPCLLVGGWAVYSAALTEPGVYWGGLFAIASGSLLAFAVLVEAVLSQVV